MKTTGALLFTFLLLLFCGSTNSQDVANTSPQTTSAAGIACTPDVYSLAAAWAKEYNLANTGNPVIIKKITPGSEAASGEKLIIVSGHDLAAGQVKTGQLTTVARQATVAVINSGNPLYRQLSEKGVSKAGFSAMLLGKEGNNWGKIVTEGKEIPIHICISAQNGVPQLLSAYLKTAAEFSAAATLPSGADVLLAVQNDPLSVGFCSLSDLPADALPSGIALLPVDKNGNGRIDYMESIYSNAGDLARGIWIGKYPKELFTGIYAVATAQLPDGSETAFLKWIITDGQKLVKSQGYSGLVYAEQQSAINRLTPIKVEAATTGNAGSLSWLLYLLAAALLIGSLVAFAVRRGRTLQPDAGPALSSGMKAFEAGSIQSPQGLWYDRSHTWAFMEQNGLVSVGLDDFMQHVTGPLTAVNMLKAGQKVKKGERLFSVSQKGKQLNLYAPVSGVISEINSSLPENPGLLNESPYAGGWVYKIEPLNWATEIKSLLMAENYRKWLTGEFVRFKDFLAASFSTGSPQYAHLVLQDGGALKNNALEEFGPEVWEDFQVKFLDASK